MNTDRVEIIHNHLRRAFINNSYGDNATHDTLSNAVKHSYQFLYDEQKALVSYEDHFIKTTRSVENLRDPNKLYFNKSFKPCININRSEIDIVNVREFRKSEFYHKEVSFNDIISHPEIFNRIPIVTIDNQTIWGYSLYFSDKYMTIILPVAAKVIFEYDRLEAVGTTDHDKRIYREHDIHIQLVNNIFYQEITISPSKLTPTTTSTGVSLTVTRDLLLTVNLPPKLENLYNKTGYGLDAVIAKFDTLIEYLNTGDIETSWNTYRNIDNKPGKDDFRDDMTYYRDNIRERYVKFKSLLSFTNTELKEHSGILFGSIYFDDIASSVLMDFVENSTNTSFIANAAMDVRRFINTSTSITLSFIFIEDLHRHRHTVDYKHRINPNSELEMPLMVPMKNDTTYEPYNSPIPVENCIVYKNNITEGTREIISSNRLKLYYPNIYQITDYELHISTLETDGSVLKTVVADDYSEFNPNTQIRISDVRQYLQFSNIGDKVYVKTDDNRDTASTYDFYYVYKDAENLLYTPVTDFFFEFLDTSLYGTTGTFEEKLNRLYFDSNDEVNDDLVSTILTYEAYIHQYGDIDFIHRYKDRTFLSDKLETRMYEDNILKNWVKYEPRVLRDYVLSQKKKGSSYYLYTKTLGDLSSRERIDISLEAPTKTTNIEGTEPVSFNETCYVFSIVNNEPADKKHQLRVFVDNLFVGDDIYTLRDKYIEYIYIPTKYVTNDSFIEVELISEFYFEDRTTFESMDDVRSYSIASPNESVIPTISDFVIYEDSNERLPKRYDHEFFDVSMVNEYGEFKTAYSDNTPLKFATMNTFKVTPKEEDILNKPLILRFSKMMEGIRYIVPKDGEVFLEFVDNRFAYHKDFLRIYINGKIVPRQNYMFYPMYHYPRIKFIQEVNEEDPSKSFVIKKGDVIYFEVSPYRYTQVYYKEDISPADEYYGILDLKSIINKPMDIRYYDIYLNGKKLSINNCIPLDPWSLKLVNLTSKYNLTIFEKERDHEYYSVDFTSQKDYPSIEEFIQKHSGNTSIIRGFFNQFIDKHGPILRDSDGNIEKITVRPNTNTDPKEYYPAEEHQYFYFIFESFYFDELMGKGFVNPDIMQVSYMVMKEWFNSVYNTYAITALESSKEDEPNAKNRRKDYIPSIAMDPDIFYNQNPGGNISEKDIVYSIGHNEDEVSQDILNQEVEIKTEKTIDKYVPEDNIDYYSEWEDDE